MSKNNTGISLQSGQYNNKTAEKYAATDPDYGRNSILNENRSLGSTGSADVMEDKEIKSKSVLLRGLLESDTELGKNTQQDRIRLLKEAVIMSEIISLPVCKRAKRRRLL